MISIKTICRSFQLSLKKEGDPLNLKDLAKEQVYSLEYWFRRKYTFSPHDPRYLECEPWEIELEYEMDKILDETNKHLLNSCPECGSVIHGNYCETCNKTVPTEKYYDPDFDKYFNQLESEGKEIPSIEESLQKPDDWEEV